MKTLILILLACFPFLVRGQTLFGTAGGTISGTDQRFDFSIGEAVTAEISGSSQVYTLGFQQPYYDFFTSVSKIESAGLSVYPNPFSNRFQVRSEKPISEYTVFDALGKTVSHQNTEGTQFTFDQPDLPKGVYSLRVVFQNQTIQFVQLLHP
jgi:hypothetical protein